MSELIERMASAAFERRHRRKWVDAHDTQRNMYRDDMRAAAEAMREPTDEMLSAAHRNNHPRDIDTWRTMIDAALKEPA